MVTYSSTQWTIQEGFRVLFATCLFIIGLLMSGCNDSSESANMEKKNIVFLISKDPNNYEADRTIPAFAAQLKDNFPVTTHVLEGNGPRSAYQFPDLSILQEADLLVVFCRRLALPDQQMEQIKDYIHSGNPVMGIRTANHAFSVRNDSIAEGFTDWWDFVPQVLGSMNEGYGPVEPGTTISVVSSAATHPILQGIEETYWHSVGNVYKVGESLDPAATVLLRGIVEEEGLDEPVAWIYKNEFGGQVFYSSVGHPADFENKDNIKILNQAVAWLIQQSNKPNQTR